MPDEQENVTDEVAETESPETPEGETQTQSLPPEVEAAIKAAAEKAAKEATEIATKAAKREIQSVKDKATAEVGQAKSRASYAESIATGLQTGFGEEDPDKAEKIRLKAELAARQQADFDAQQTRAREKFETDFRSNMTQVITSLGVDPSDKEIDWAEEEKTDYLAKQRTILDSVGKLVKAKEDKFEQRLKDVESKVGEEANSVDTSASGGATGSDKDFLEKWNSGELRPTKENLARIEKIIQ